MSIDRIIKLSIIVACIVSNFSSCRKSQKKSLDGKLQISLDVAIVTKVGNYA